MRELRDRGLIRSSNNPVADLAEGYVAGRLGLTLATTVTAGYDAAAPDGTRYQVKGRRMTAVNQRRAFGFLRNLSAGSSTSWRWSPSRRTSPFTACTCCPTTP